jgi:predicted nucleotidyltransferase
MHEPSPTLDRDPIERLRFALKAAPEDLVCTYIFGSQARGTARADSDLDLGLVLAEDPPSTLFRVHAYLAERLAESTGKRVDLTVLNRASPDLVHRVLRDGILVLERSRSRRIAFEVAARNAYFDLLSHLQRDR